MWGELVDGSCFRRARPIYFPRLSGRRPGRRGPEDEGMPLSLSTPPSGVFILRVLIESARLGPLRGADGFFGWIWLVLSKKNEVGLPTTWGADRGAGAMGAGSLLSMFLSVCFIFFLIIKSTKKSKRETIKRIRAGSRRGALRADSARPTPPCVIKADWSWSVRESCHQCFSTGERVAFFTSRRWSPPPPRRARG
jgi:hypothetical protein